MDGRMEGREVICCRIVRAKLLFTCSFDARPISRFSYSSLDRIVHCFVMESKWTTRTENQQPPPLSTDNHKERKENCPSFSISSLLFSSFGPSKKKEKNSRMKEGRGGGGARERGDEKCDQRTACARASSSSSSSS